MKVAHVFWGLYFGGIETMLVNIANAQAALGAEVSIILLNEHNEESLIQSLHSNVRLILLHRSAGSKNPVYIFKLNEELKKIKPDAIHLHESRFFKLLINRRLSRAACCTLHDLPKGSVRRVGILPRLFPLLDFTQHSNVHDMDKIPKVFTISKAVKEDLEKNYNIRSIVVENGILTGNFKVREPKMLDGKMRIVQVSRLSYQKKGQDLLIEAVAKMQGEVEVDFIGDGAGMEYLKQLCKDLHADSHIHFLGNRTQQYIAEHLCYYDLFVQPSRWEGFGLTVAEAMAAGVPVLVSAGQGPAEVTCNGKYGWVFENGNIEDLQQQITYIRTHYKDAITKAEKARQYVKDTYDVSVTAKKYLEQYTKKPS